MPLLNLATLLDYFASPLFVDHHVMNSRPGCSAKWLVLAVALSSLTGCGTVVAVADAVGTATVYTVKTVVNTVDAITPDIVNGDDDDDD